MKRLLSDTVREIFGIERQFSSLEVVMFYLIVAITTGMVLYLI